MASLVERLTGDDYTCPESMGCGTMKFCACSTMEEAAARITELETELAAAQHQVKGALVMYDALVVKLEAKEAELAAMKARGDRLAEALGPFAAMAAAYDPDDGDGAQWAFASRPTICQVRIARQALTEWRNQ